jgi:hypothetical protein
MRFRLGTLQVFIALSAAPVWMLCEGAKAGCFAAVMVVWDSLVVVPLFIMCLSLARVKTEAIRDQVVAIFGAIAIVGYVIAVPVSLAAIAFYCRQSIL